MQLNSLKPARGSKRPHFRVGRGIGCGNGKTCGRGHKGQRARAGGFHKVGFEGGQMPMQRRLPKFGFNSHLKAERGEVNLNQLKALKLADITLDTLKEVGLIARRVKKVKVILTGTIETALNLKGLMVTKGARAAIEAAGGKIEE